MAERIDVMISSTARDLPIYRQHAMDACWRQGMFPIMMEHLPAMDADAIKASLEMVDDAETYLGIFANRYGYIPEGYEISITEMEYNRAVERGIPRLIFIVEDGVDNFAPDEDPTKQTKLEAFKERLKTEQVVGFFSDPSEFRVQVISSLAHIKLRKTATLTMLSLIPSAPHPYVAHPYTLLESGGLFGRKAELDLLNNWLHGVHPELAETYILSVVAIGGMGKSSLTWAWFNELMSQENNLAGMLWWSFYETDAHYENFITRTLAYVSSQPEDLIRRKALPQRENDLLAILQQQPFLLVLDGLERILTAYNRHDAPQQLDTPEQIVGQALEQVAIGIRKIFTAKSYAAREQKRLRKTADPRAGYFLRKLATVSNSRILVSTRLHPADLETNTGEEIQGCQALWLGGLADQDALELWKSFGVNGDEHDLLELFHSFANYPLLIKALAAEVAHYRRAPKDFDAWRRANTQFNPFSLPMVQRQSHVLQHALIGLEDNQAQILRTVAAFNSPVSYGTLADLLVDGGFFESDPQLDSALTELEERGLLGWDRSKNRYDLHPVVRGIIWSSLEQADQKDLYENIRAHLENVPFEPNWRKIKKREELTPLIELYHTLIGLGRFDQAGDILENRLYRPLRYSFSDGQTLVNLFEMLIPPNTDLPKLNQISMQATVLNKLAQAYQMTGQPQRAVPLFQRSNRLKEEGHYTVDLSQGWRDLAYAQRLVGNLRYSEMAARQALRLDRLDGNIMLEAISLQVLGLALAAKGDFDESAKALDRSLDLADRSNANRAYNHQAMRALWFGNHSSAFDWSTKAQEYCRKKRLEAQLILAYRLQGEAALGLNMMDIAEENLHYALTHARAVKLMEEEIAALIALAELRRRQKNYALARELLDDVWDVCETAPYKLFHADACNVLAYLERDLGDFGAAVGAANRAFELSWCDGEPYAYHFGLQTARTHLAVLDQPEPQLQAFDADSTVPMVMVPIEP